MQTIINGHVYKARVRAIEETLNQPDEKALSSQPFESRQYLFKNRSHVQARRRKHAVHHTKYECKGGPDRQ